MTSMIRRALSPALALAVTLLVGGCQTGEDASKTAQENPSAPALTPATPTTPGPGPSVPGNPGDAIEGLMRKHAGGPLMPAPPGFGEPGTPIQKIMRRLAGGPDSLTPKLGNQLKVESPDWATIQGETKDYAAAAKQMVTHEPPQGSQESWQELAGAFADHADEMDRAAQAKDKEAALVAHDQLAISCKACHTAHQPPSIPR